MNGGGGMVRSPPTGASANPIQSADQSNDAHERLAGAEAEDPGPASGRRRRRGPRPQSVEGPTSGAVPRSISYGGMAPYGMAAFQQPRAVVVAPPSGPLSAHQAARTPEAAFVEAERMPLPAAGMIFGCSDSTLAECMASSVAGMLAKYAPLAQTVVAGTTLVFLFNYSSRTLHGTFVATSNAEVKPASELFRDHARPERDCPYPVQIKFKAITHHTPIREASCRHILQYTDRGRFRCKLSKMQCNDLVDVIAQAPITAA